MKVNYSVIIPHKNAQGLLTRCLNSIPKRDDIQIIVVDDNSNISNEERNTFPGTNNPYVVNIFTKEGKGAGYARNIGLQRARGKWILFADADDFFNKGAFEHFDKYLDSDFDIVYFSANSVFSDTLAEAKRHHVVEKIIIEYLNNSSNSEDKLRYGYIWPWNKLIRHDLIRKYSIKFDEVKASNDMMFSLKTGHYANKIAADIFQAYCVTISSDSLTRTISKENQRSRYLAAIRQYKFMESINRPDLRFHLLSFTLHSLRFGFSELFWYLKTAKNEKVNIFLGFYKLPKKISDYIKRRKSRDNHYTIIK